MINRSASQAGDATQLKCCSVSISGNICTSDCS